LKAVALSIELRDRNPPRCTSAPDHVIRWNFIHQTYDSRSSPGSVGLSIFLFLGTNSQELVEVARDKHEQTPQICRFHRERFRRLRNLQWFHRV